MMVAASFLSLAPELLLAVSHFRMPDTGLLSTAAPLPTDTVVPSRPGQPAGNPDFWPVFGGILAVFSLVSTVLGVIGEKWVTGLNFWLRTFIAALFPSILLSALLIFFVLLPRNESLLAAARDFVVMPLRGYVVFVLAIMLGGFGAACSGIWLKRRRDRKQIMDQAVFE